MIFVQGWNPRFPVVSLLLGAPVILDCAGERQMQNQRSKALADIEDEDLVIRSQNGDKAAFSELVGRHYNACLRLASTILRNRDDAEDEVQNALSKAFEHLGQFQRGCRFSTWLTRIVVNQCLMRIRQVRRNRTVSIDEPWLQEEGAGSWEIPDLRPGPDHALANEQIRRIVDTEIRRIPPLLRSAFTLRHVEKLPMTEVADRLGISVAAAKSRLLRARLELQQRLEKHQGKLGPATLVA
jgi:RNA polymerase sigma-70 factor, ECF subfamily